MQLHSARTRKYVEAMVREGVAFNYDAWLQRVRAEEAYENGSALPSTPEKATQNVMCERSVVPQAFVSATKNTAPMLPARLGAPKPSKNGQTKSAQAKLSDARVAEGLLDVCAAWEGFQSSRARDAVYRYLKAVFVIVSTYKGKKEKRRLLRKAAKLAGLDIDKNTEAFAAVIRCTCENKLDNKTISKWARALRYAAYRNRPPRLLKSFMKARGGINACAGLYSKVSRDVTGKRK